MRWMDEQKRFEGCLERETYEEERVCEERIDENERPKRTRNFEKSSCNSQNDTGMDRYFNRSSVLQKYVERQNNSPNEFIPPVSDQIHKLTRALDIQKITPKFDEDKVQNHYGNCSRSRFSQNLRVEILFETFVYGGEEDVCHNSHH